MSERYVRPTIGGWLRPLLLGPGVSVYTAVSLYAAFGPEGRFVGRWAQWALGMLLGTLVAMAYVLVQSLVDVLLLAIRQRALATGQRAWAAAMGAPIAILGTYVVRSPWSYYRYGAWAVAAGFLVPILVVAFAVRIVFGARIDAGSSSASSEPPSE